MKQSAVPLALALRLPFGLSKLGGQCFWHYDRFSSISGILTWFRCEMQPRAHATPLPNSPAFFDLSPDRGKECKVIGVETQGEI